MAPRTIDRMERIEPDITSEQYDLALRRTRFLLRMPQRSLQDLIANAWIQGVGDAAETIAEKAQPHD